MPNPMFRKDKAIIITGGAKRIGRALALALAQSGYDIIIHANNSLSDAIDLKTQILDLGMRAEIIQSDLSKPAEAYKIITKAREFYGKPIFALINCASIFEADSARDFSIEEFEAHQNINLLAPLLLSQAFFHQTDGLEGTIINLLDQRVLKPNPLFFTYTLSKMGLMAATKTMAQEFAPNVRVNAIAPGPTLKNARQSDEDFVSQFNATLLGLGSPLESIIEAALFLLSAKSTTGQVLAVDGGQNLLWQTKDIEGIIE